MKKYKLYIFDLDGTLVSGKINNTYTFIREYLFSKKRHIEYYIKKILSFIIHYILFFYKTRRKDIIINIFFKYMDIRKLEKFAEGDYLQKIVKPNLRKDILKYIQGVKKNQKGIVTSCTEIPAKQIAQYLKMPLLISTTFHVRKNRIVGTNQIITHHNKQEYVKEILSQKDLFQSIYFVDNPATEKETVELFGGIYHVK